MYNVLLFFVYLSIINKTSLMRSIVKVNSKEESDFAAKEFPYLLTGEFKPDNNHYPIVIYLDNETESIITGWDYYETRHGNVKNFKSVESRLIIRNELLNLL